MPQVLPRVHVIVESGFMQLDLSFSFIPLEKVSFILLKYVPEKRQQFWDPEDQEYFFDRHYYAFRAIFDFYRTGKLRRPLEMISE